ncbi:hypothetical protein Tco_1515589 [Tanacetum coccineum]
MLCYLGEMEPYYLKCIKDGLFQPKTDEGDNKPESQWTPDERRIVIQDQRLKSIIMSCLPDDIMDSVISCETAKATWIDLVHSFEGPSDTKKKRIMNLKLEYQTFRAKPSKSISQTYTRYKTFLNELANDGISLSKHEINVGFVNSLPEKWLTFSKGLRNANLTQTLNLANIYGRFVYEDNLIGRRYSDYKKALVTTPSNSSVITAFFSNNDDEEVTQVKVLMALADDELTVGKNHARNGEWIDITMRKSTKRSNDPESSKSSESEPCTPLPPLKDLQGASPSSKVMSLVYQPHSPRERLGLGMIKHTKPETHDSSSKSVSRIVTKNMSEPITPSVPTEIANTEQESKIDELSKLV